MKSSKYCGCSAKWRVHSRWPKPATRKLAPNTRQLSTIESRIIRQRLDIRRSSRRREHRRATIIKRTGNQRHSHITNAAILSTTTTVSISSTSSPPSPSSSSPPSRTVHVWPMAAMPGALLLTRLHILSVSTGALRRLAVHLRPSTTASAACRP